MRRNRFEGDPIEALRGADPLDPLDVPKDTTGAHARALFQEVTSMDTMERQETRQVRPAQRRFAWAGAAAALAVVVAAGFALLSGGESADDVIAGETTVATTVGTETTTGSTGGTDAPIVGGEPVAAAAMCAVFYDINTLAADVELAFDGTVASSNGDAVTFDVNTWFSGGDEPSVTLQAMGIAPGTITSAGAALEIGQRYLVAGSGGSVWSCGFTMTYDTNIAGQWATAFSG